MLFPRVPGEPVDLRICRIVRAYEGCSLVTRRGDLAELVEAAGPPGCVAWTTNCATFALGVLRAACGDLRDACAVHPLLSDPLVIGDAFTRLVRIGVDLKAWRVPMPNDPPPPPGAFMWYEIDGKNDDHVEIRLTGDGGERGFEHGGGGRAGNAITIGFGDVEHSVGRPLHRWLDTMAMGIPWLPLDEDPGPSGPLVEG